MTATINTLDRLCANVSYNQVVAVRIPCWIEDDLRESRHGKLPGVSPIWIDEPHRAEAASRCASERDLIAVSRPIRPRCGDRQSRARQRVGNTSRRRNHKQLIVLPGICRSAEEH